MRFSAILPAFFIALMFLVTASPALAGQKLDQARVDAAVKKGLEYLKGLQQADGSWNISKNNSPGRFNAEGAFPYGNTALALFTLIKGGEPKKSLAVRKAVAYLRSHKYKSTYGTSCLILALVALIDESSSVKKEKKEEEGGLVTEAIDDAEAAERKKFKKAPSWIRKMIREAVAYLIKVKGPRVWRYPGTNVGVAGTPASAADSGDQDASNTQYVMMALFAARRKGIKVNPSVFANVAEYFLTEQETSGPEVKPFRVPGADLNLSKLIDMEKEWTKEFNRRLKEGKKQAKKEKKEYEGMDLGTIARGDPYAEFGAEIPKMNARGWSYLQKKYKGAKTGRGGTFPADWVNPTGSMTCSGVIACMLCKVYLEKTSWYKKNGKKLKKAIRDGLAWVVHNWSANSNPNSRVWKYYYFYAVERAGVLSLTQMIGPHDWYYELGSTILSTQSGDGSWPAEQRSYGTAMWNTCFAILFLKRATTPIIKEEIIYTGDVLKKSSDKKDKE